MLTRVRLWLRSLLFGRRLDRERRAEIADHLARTVQRLTAQGMTRDEAERAARREFGNLAVVHEQARDARGGRRLESLAADVRFGLRQFARRPGSTITMIVVLALGIGFNTALFVLVSSLVSGVPPGFTPDDSLVRIRGIERNTSRGYSIGREFSYREYAEYAAQTDLFSAVAAWTSSDVALNVGRDDENLVSGAATYVTAGYFQVLGVRPIAGAGLPATAPNDTGSPDPVAVISHVVWDRFYDQANDVIGRTLEVNGVPVTIVGVAPRRFNGARSGGSQVRVWLPLSARPLVQRTAAQAAPGLDAPIFGLVARLQPGVETAHTLPIVQAIAARTAQQVTPSGGHVALSTDVVPGTRRQLLSTLRRSRRSVEAVRRPSARHVDPDPRAVDYLHDGQRPAGGPGDRAATRDGGASRTRCAAAPARSTAGDGERDAGGWRRSAGPVRHLGPAADVRVGHSGSPGGDRLAEPRVHRRARARHGHPVRPLAGAARDTAGAVGRAERLRRPAGSVALAPAGEPGRGPDRAHAAGPAGHGGVVPAHGRERADMPRAVHADRILDARFNTNPRYGPLDGRREQTLARLRTRFAALPGVVAVVPQENTDDYLQVTVHPSDGVPGVELPSSLEARAHAAPTGYFQLMSIPVVLGRGFDPAGGDPAGAIVVGARPGPPPVGRGGPDRQADRQRRRLPTQAWCVHRHRCRG